LIAYNDCTGDEPTISKLTRLGSKPGAGEGTPVMADNDALPAVMQELLPQSDDGLRHGLKHLIWTVIGQTVTAAVPGQIDSDQGVCLVQSGVLQKVPPEQVRVGEAVHEEGDIARGRGIGAGVDDVMDVGAGRSGEEGVLKARKRFAIEAPVSFLGCDVSAHHLPLDDTQRTSR
jgi:hypothetical protein